MAYNPTNPNGQATMANSQPVTVASDQSSIQTQLATDLPPTTGSITTSTSTITVTDLSGIGAVSVQIAGTYAGVNVTFEASIDGTIWTPIFAQPTNSATPTLISTTGVLTTNSTNSWNVSPLLGQQQFRVRATAFVSGSASVIIEPSAQFTQYLVNVGTMPTTTVTGTVTSNLGTGGTGATSLGKAEDAVHASGDTGVAMWGVRNDNAATTLTSATGDYSGVAVDGTGSVFTRPAPATTGTTPASVPAATTSTQVLASNPAARLRTLNNSSTSDCYVRFGTAASTTAYNIFIPAGGGASFNGEDYAGVVHAIWNTATGNMIVGETQL